MSIIPIRCFTCGNILADKWIPYLEACKQHREIAANAASSSASTSASTSAAAIRIDTESRYFSPKQTEKSIQGKTLDTLGLRMECCRRVMLSHIDMD